jgi:hypothetical protein
MADDDLSADTLSEAEWGELDSRIRKLKGAEGENRMLALLAEFTDEQGRIPTPVDEGFSGWFGRLIGEGHDELLMNTRVGSDWGRWMRTKLREIQSGKE